MGRQHLKLPEHLYLSPPPPPTSSPSPYSLLSLTSTYTSSAALFHETSSNALAVSDRIPGFKTSAAFLNSLRANITLQDDSAPTSLTNTPDSLRPINMASSTGSLPPPSPLANPPDTTTSDATTTISPSVPDEIPLLTTLPAHTDDDKIASLKLLADSVAQMRQRASNALIFHPLTIAAWMLCIAAAGQLQYDGTRGSLALVGVTTAGLSMAVLISVRWAVSGYIELAENVGTWKWLEGVGEGEGQKVEDVVLLEKFGEEAVGTVVLRGVREEGIGGSAKKGGKKQQHGAGNIHGVIRGWTVKQRYRKKGLGTGLLEDAVKVCAEKGWSGLRFADVHANSGRILWPVFNGAMEAREKKARALLEKVVAEQQEQLQGALIVGGTEKEKSSGGGRRRK